MVVLATFLIEVALAFYAWWRYRSTRFGRLSIAFLFLLAGFQLSEYLICLGSPWAFWSRIGFICTTFLPIIAIDFIFDLRRQRRSMVWGYALALAFSAVIALYPALFQEAVCNGKFVTFKTSLLSFDLAYLLYYLTTLFIGIGLAYKGLKEKNANRQALIWLLIGYAVIIIPTFLVYALNYIGSFGIASVLCGFAVFLALILAFRILPSVHRRY